MTTSVGINVYPPSTKDQDSNDFSIVERSDSTVIILHKISQFISHSKIKKKNGKRDHKMNWKRNAKNTENNRNNTEIERERGLMKNYLKPNYA